MWNSTFKDKPRKPLKRSGFKQKAYKPLKRSILRQLGKSPASLAKQRIQVLLREICMKRDKGCILASVRCRTYMGDIGVVWQADHLISRGNSATYGDSRLVVLICKGCHGWKSVGSNLRKKEYDTLVRRILPPAQVALWDMAEADSHRAHKMDWQLVEICLQKELLELENGRE